MRVCERWVGARVWGVGECVGGDMLCRVVGCSGGAPGWCWVQGVRVQGRVG